ncbi:MAG: SCO family protein [Proteobacteria bacterium]|nr:SCO family protein [Pseudomonadota bacterium]MDA1243966.1 SCO family protein [Pseudomonadota bacterium]
MSKRLLIAFIVVDILLGLAVYRGYTLWNAGEEAAELTRDLREKGTTLFPDSRPLSRFDLVDSRGEAFTNVNLTGKWSLVFFGFTHCPDICPMTMKELAEMTAQLSPAERAKLQVILGTVDPERDDSATMAEYVAQYDDAFIGLTGTRIALSVLTKQLYVTYSDPEALISHDDHDGSSIDDNADNHAETAMSELDTVNNESHSAHGMADENQGESQDEDRDYLITHSGHIAIINPQGELHGVIRPPHRDRDLLAVVKVLLAD